MLQAPSDLSAMHKCFSQVLPASSLHPVNELANQLIVLGVESRAYLGWASTPSLNPCALFTLPCVRGCAMPVLLRRDLCLLCIFPSASPWALSSFPDYPFLVFALTPMLHPFSVLPHLQLPSLAHLLMLHAGLSHALTPHPKAPDRAISTANSCSEKGVDG